MVQFKPPKSLFPKGDSKILPTEFDLPDSDNRPVDNELQILLPIMLRGVLELAWPDRRDWYFGVNLGIYYNPKKPAVGPDGFISLGVPYLREGKDLRLSYLLWHEKVVPQWVLEVVSKKPGKEYDEKMALYAQLGVLYYTIFNPKHAKRDGHNSFEVYRLVEGRYVLQPGSSPVWMPELGLGVGVARGEECLLPARDWVYFYDEQGRQYPTKDSLIGQSAQQLAQAELSAQRAGLETKQAKLEAEQAKLEAEQAKLEMAALLQKLRDRNIDP
ncbi:MAG: Uma2 family endonuclease, partial [Cyanobacteria bacterium J06560_2]